MKHQMFEVWLSNRTSLWTVLLPTGKQVFPSRRKALEASLLYGTGKQMGETNGKA